MKIQLKCPKMPSIEARCYDYDIPPAKDDILLLDGSAFVVLCRQYDNSQNFITTVLVIEPVDMARAF